MTAPAGATPPETTIAAAPAGVVASSSASISFSSRVAGVALRVLARRRTVRALRLARARTPGSRTATHVFDVRAVDAAGNADPSPAHAAWTVDTTRADDEDHVRAAPPGPRRRGRRSAFVSGGAAPGSSARSTAARSGRAVAAVYSGLRPGTHTFRVRGGGPCGERRPLAGTADVDGRSNAAAHDDHARTEVGHALDLGHRASSARTSAADASSCSLDGGAYALCRSPLRRSRPRADDPHGPRARGRRRRQRRPDGRDAPLAIG